MPAQRAEDCIRLSVTASFFRIVLLGVAALAATSGRSLALAQLSMKNPNGPAKQAGSITVQQRKRLAAAISQMTPKQRKQLAKAMKRMTPEQQNQVADAMVRQTAPRKP
jgi:hypothetical protein